MLLIVYRNDKLKEEKAISKVIEERKSKSEENETTTEAVKKNELENFEPGRNIQYTDPGTTQVKLKSIRAALIVTSPYNVNKDYKNLPFCIHCFLGT